MDMKTNPAGRFVLLLRAGKKLDGNVAAIKIWQTLLKVPDGRVPLLLHRYGQVLRLPEQIREQVLRQPDINQDLYLRWVPTVESAFKSYNLDAAFAAFIQKIDEPALTGLEFCSDLLGRHSPDKVLNEEEMQAIYSDASALMDRVLSLSIDEPVKRFIVDRLDAVMSAIQEYDFRGPQPLESAIEAAVGAVCIHKKVASQVDETEEGKALWKIIGRAGVLMQLAQGAMEIGVGITKLLTP